LINRLLILFGLLLAVVAVWLTLGTGRTAPVTAQAVHPAMPDEGYSAINASVIETGADGRPMYTLQALQVQQDPQSDLVNLTTVHMTFRDASGGQWHARADQAVARQESAQIDLAGSVVVDGNFAGNDQPAHLHTDRLHVDTHADIIRTRSPVTLDWSGAVVQAHGLVLNIKEHNIKLEAEVHGQFQR
jgi:LPS export ABC transporter protein LptC